MSATAAIPNSVQLKQILYLTDFSRASEAALPVALGVARSHGSTIHVLHVITAPLETYPESLKADREIAEGEMKAVDVRLRGVTHDTSVTHAFDLWSGIERFIAEHGIDLVVIGTHGRTGAERLLLGSVADEIFRRSPVPVMTVGPDVKHEPADNGALDRILFATDFSPRSAAALPFAIALAKENHSRLLLLHALSKQRGTGDGNGGNRELSVAEAFHQLHQMLPGDLALPQSPDFAVEFGRPGDAIIAAAEQRGACVIILGIRGAEGRLGVASHLDRATAHKVVAHAPCPVLTVRA